MLLALGKLRAFPKQCCPPLALSSILRLLSGSAVLSNIP